MFQFCKTSSIRGATRAAHVLALVTTFFLASVSLSGGALHTDGIFFRDSSGAVVLLRGVNVAGNSKVPPFMPITDQGQLDPLPDWGINVIRLVFNWEAYEPVRGQYNDAYLAYLKDIAAAAWARGIYTVVEFHQDVFSRYISQGCGSGFPGWALSPSATPDVPDNGPGCASWILFGTLDPDLRSSFSDFYSDRYGVRSRYLLLLARLAATLRSEPGVIGYDLMNEPWGREIVDIAPLYEDAAAVVRAFDPSAIIFIEPHIATVPGDRQTYLPAPSFDNFAYAPHFYDPTIIDAAWGGDVNLMDAAFWRMASKAGIWQAPLFLGEFGGPAVSIGIETYMDLIYARLNTYVTSGAQWNYTPGWTPESGDGWNGEDMSIVDDQGQLRQNFRPRPYAQRISGTPLRLRAPGEDSLVELHWIHDSAAGRTEIFVPAAASASQSLSIESNADSCSVDVDRPIVSCESSVDGIHWVRVRSGP